MYKRSEFQAKVQQLRPDIIGLTEINPKNASWSLMEQDLNLTGYTLYANLKGRGVVLYVRDSIQSREMTIVADTGTSVWCELMLRGGDTLVVGVVYRSPAAAEEQTRSILQLIDEVVSKKPTHLLIIGDFNFPEIDWTLQTSEGSCQEKLFLESFRNCFLHQHVMKPTHYRALQRANILDLVMTSEESMIDEILYEDPIGKSDHLCLNWSFKCYAENKIQSTKVTKYSYEKGEYDDMRSDLGEERWDETLRNRSTDEQWNIISDKIRAAMDKHIPHRTYTGKTGNHSKPAWMNSRVLSRIKQKKSTFEQYSKTGDWRDYLEYTIGKKWCKG